MKREILKIFLLLLPALAVGQIVVEPGEANLRAALKQAQPGDVLFLKNGVYERTDPADTGRFIVDTRDITIIGESRDGVVILGTNSGAVNGATSATLFLPRTVNNFYAENITIDNSSVNGQQLAVFSENDSVIFNGCRILGFQDAHRADKKRSYFVNCETGGDVDFIYSDGACMYEFSRVICRKRGERASGYILAPDDHKNTTANGTTRAGLVIKHSVITADSGVGSNTFYLGRPWGHNNSGVFISCKLGPHIRPQGWDIMGSDTYLSSYMGEFGSVDFDGNPIDVSQRVKWSKKLSVSDTNQYTINNFFKGWNPRIKTQSPLLAAPNVWVSSNQLIWEEVSEARGYLLFRNDSLVDYIAAGAAIYNIEDKPNERYSLKTVNRYGRPGAMSEVVQATEPGLTAVVGGKAAAGLQLYVADNIAYLPENEEVNVYNMLGVRLLWAEGARQVSLNGLKQGVYIVQVKLDKKGSVVTQKVVVR